MNAIDARHYLLELKVKWEKVENKNSYPFNLPAVHNLDKLTFHPAITFIIGENGTGKSTLLEAIAVAYGFNPEGGSKNFNFSTRNSHAELHKYIQLVKNYKRPRDGYFLRAESFYNVATNIDELDEEPSDARPIKDSYGGTSLHQRSHGESFFDLFNNRFGGNGLYILDEPEAALSPMRQMAMLSKIHSLINDQSQFIIATHSPIIMAYPNAKIIVLSNDGHEESSYKETEHFQITKNFLNNPEKYLLTLTNKN